MLLLSRYQPHQSGPGSEPAPQHPRNTNTSSHWRKPSETTLRLAYSSFYPLLRSKIFLPYPYLHDVPTTKFQFKSCLFFWKACLSPLIYATLHLRNKGSRQLAGYKNISILVFNRTESKERCHQQQQKCQTWGWRRETILTVIISSNIRLLLTMWLFSIFRVLRGWWRNWRFALSWSYSWRNKSCV